MGTPCQDTPGNSHPPAQRHSLLQGNLRNQLLPPSSPDSPGNPHPKAMSPQLLPQTPLSVHLSVPHPLQREVQQL